MVFVKLNGIAIDSLPSNICKKILMSKVKEDCSEYSAPPIQHSKVQFLLLFFMHNSINDYYDFSKVKIKRI